MKRLISFALCAVLLLGLQPAGAAEPGFSDVPPDAWYADYAAICAEDGLMGGTGNGNFSPEQTLTTLECAALAARLHWTAHGGEGPLPSAPAGFASLQVLDGDGGGVDGTFPTAYIESPEAGTVRLSIRDSGLAGGMPPADRITLILGGSERWEGQYDGESEYGDVYYRFPTDREDAEFYLRRSLFNAGRTDGGPAPGAWALDACWYLEQHAGMDASELLWTGGAACTRGEFVTLLAPAADGLLSPINHIEALPDTQDPRVLAFYNAGILSGADRYGTFYGYNSLTRADAAAMLARLVRPELRASFTLENTPYTLKAVDADTERYVVRSFDLDYLRSSTPTDAYGWLYLQERTTDRAGVMDRDGNWVISPDEGYDAIAFFCADGIAAASRERLWGYIDRDGNEVVPFRYDYVSHLHDGFVLGGNWHGDVYDVYAPNGTLLRSLPAKTEDYVSLTIFDVAGGLIPFSETENYDTKMGYLNPDGTVALEANWYAAKPFSDGLAAVLDGPPPLKSVNFSWSRYGFIDKEGNLLISHRFLYSGGPPFFHDGAACSLSGWIDKSGAAWPEWQENPLPQDWYGPDYDGMYRYLDRNFTPATPPIFEQAAPAWDGAAWVVRDGQICLLTLPE